MATYAPTWTRSANGNYNEQKAYTGLVAGTGAGIMEDEFNEAQWLMSQQHAKKFAMAFSSGSFSKGTDTVSSGTLTMAPRDLLVAGHAIRMQGKAADSGNVKVTLPAAPTSGTRQDIVYLVLSYVVVNYQSTLYAYGYQSGDTITNDMYDNRAPGETQHRVQKQWSIQTASGQTVLTALGYTATTYDANLYTKSLAGTVDGLQYAIPLYIANRTAGSPDTLTDVSYYLFSSKNAGQAGGFATLGSDGHLPAAQLPTDVPKTDATQTWTAAQTFNNPVTSNQGATNSPAYTATSSGTGWGSGIQYANTTPSTGRTYGSYSGSDGNFHFTDVTAGTDRFWITPSGAFHTMYSTIDNGTDGSAVFGGGIKSKANGLDVSGNMGVSTLNPSYGLHVMAGAARIQGLATPASPTVTPIGTTGTTSYTYYVVAKDRNGNRSIVSAATTTSTGNAALNGTNYNAISWTAVAGAVSYDVLKGNTTSLLGNTTGTSLNDTGQATSAYTPPTHNESGDLTIDGNVSIVGALNPSTTAPTNPTDGMPWYDLTNHRQKYYSAGTTSWVDPLKYQ